MDFKDQGCGISNFLSTATFYGSFSSVLILALGGMSRAVVWIPLISGAPFFGLPGSF